MSRPQSLRSGALSITGDFRQNNEDNYVVDPQGRYFVVADGMGGQSAGEKASELAIETFVKAMKSFNFDKDDATAVGERLDSIACAANAEIMALGNLDPQYHNMGTTLAFAVVVGGSIYVGNVGDSRVYLLRKGQLKQLTTDHSLTQALLDAGTISTEEAATHRYRNVLYRYLGSKEGSAGTDSQRFVPRKDDKMLLCSDGVTDGLPDERIAELLAAEAEPEQLAEQLVRAAQDGGSRDNITCIVIAAG